jgi:hypothetical protein
MRKDKTRLNEKIERIVFAGVPVHTPIPLDKLIEALHKFKFYQDMYDCFRPTGLNNF